MLGSGGGGGDATFDDGDFVGGESVEFIDECINLVLED